MHMHMGSLAHPVPFELAATEYVLLGTTPGSHSQQYWVQHLVALQNHAKLGPQC